MFCKVEGRLLPAQLFVSKPGRLSCKNIIHAVGPRWKGGHQKEEDTLCQTITNVLMEACHRFFTTVAIPAISTGIFDFPLQKATDIILSTAAEFLRSNETSLREVHIVDTDQQVISMFEKKLRDIDHNLAQHEAGASRLRHEAPLDHGKDDQYQGENINVFRELLCIIFLN